MRQVRAVHSPPDDHLHRLHSTLVATVPAVSIALLPRVLEECKAVITSLSDPAAAAQRRYLVQMLFKELSENVGDAEKEYSIRWWYENRASLAAHPVQTVDGLGAESTSSASEPARL